MKKSLLQLHLAVLLWGFTGVLGRAISLAAPVLVWYRMLLTAVIMAAILTYRKQWVRFSRADFFRIMIIGALIAAHWVAFYGSIKLANASIALITLSTASIFTAILDPLVNKSKKDPIELLLSLLAIAGVYYIYRFQQFFAVGIVLGIIAAMLSALFTVLNKGIAHKYPIRTIVFYEMSFGWMLITLLAPLQLYFYPGTALMPHWSGAPGGSWFQNDWLWLVILSLCCTVWAQSLALSSLRTLSSFTVTLSVNLEPVYGILMAVLIYKENADFNTGFYLGMGLICISVVLQIVRTVIRTADVDTIKQ